MRYPALVALLALAACREEVAPPGPVVMSDDALGHYCQMVVADHEGPKAQVHLSGQAEPLFFAQVRDGIAYLREPERTADIRAIYVSNMSRAPSWSSPGTDNWIEAGTAFLVVGSDAMGGMGAPEVVPFETLDDAEGFAAERGGKVMSLGDVPDDAVLGAIDPMAGHHIPEG